MATGTETRPSHLPNADAYGPQGRSEWLDVDWHAHLHWAQLPHGTVNYVDIGEGPALVFIHGLSGCWQNWLENIPFFSHSFRVIALDLPGFGSSPMPPEKITINNYAAVVDELLDSLGIERAAVVGNSMGGFIGAELAIRFSTRVSRLVLVSAAVLWQEYRRAKPLVALAQTSEALTARALANGTPAVALRPRVRHAILRWAGFRYPHRLPKELQVELIRTAPRTRGFLPALQALADFPLREELGDIACPTLIVWGTDDPLVGVRHASELERSIPDARKVIFEKTGHEPMLERPERFNRLLDEFVGDQTSSGQRPWASKYARAASSSSRSVSLRAAK